MLAAFSAYGRGESQYMQAWAKAKREFDRQLSEASRTDKPMTNEEVKTLQKSLFADADKAQSKEMFEATRAMYLLGRDTIHEYKKRPDTRPEPSVEEKQKIAALAPFARPPVREDEDDKTAAAKTPEIKTGKPGKRELSIRVPTGRKGGSDEVAVPGAAEKVTFSSSKGSNKNEGTSAKNQGGDSAGAEDVKFSGKVAAKKATPTENAQDGGADPVAFSGKDAANGKAKSTAENNTPAAKSDEGGAEDVSFDKPAAKRSPASSKKK